MLARSRAFGFVTAVCFAATLIGVAPEARSGPPLLSDPFDFDACGDTDVASGMLSPAGRFSVSLSVSACRRNCKMLAKECQQLVKQVTACRLRYSSVDKDLRKQNCEIQYPTPQEQKICKQAAGDGAEVDKRSYKTEGDLAVDDCDAWGQTCQNTCET